MASEDDPKTKRARTSRPKVKTGCANCKQRRIKCDEKRPACTQCVRSKKECGGYPPPPRSARPFDVVPIAPKPGLPLLSAAPAPALAAAPAPTPVLAPALAPAPTPTPVPARTLALAPTSHPGLAPVCSLQPLHPPLLVPPAVPTEEHDAQHEQRQHRQQRKQAQLQLNPRRAQKLNYRRNGLFPSQAWSGVGHHFPPAPVPNFLYQPSTALPLTPQEEHYFRLFRFHTANELSGFFDNVFWSETVLVACHAADAIRHAVVALGALYKTLEKTTESPPTSPNNPAAHDARDTAYSHWEMALRHYSNACHALAVTSAQDAATQRTRLMASVLLACFDSFVGDHKQAIVQIQTGLALLERLRAERRQARGPGSVAEEPVEDELTQMFTRLAIQAKSYDMAFHFPQPYVIRLLPAAGAAGSSSSPAEPPVPRNRHPIPARFSDLRQARLAWDALCERIFRFMEYMFQQAQGPPNLLPQYIAQYGEEFVRDNEAWARAFEPLLQSRTNPGISSQEKAGIAVLKMFQIMGQILYLMTFSDSEMKFDAFQPHFKAIVCLAAEVVGDEERRAAAARCPDPAQCKHYQSDDYGLRGPYDPLVAAAAAAGGHGHRSSSSSHLGCRASHIKASFSADLGIVPPLYVVATKSRDRLLRRQAIHLLRSSARREGMWDSELMARVGMWVVEIEEDGEEEEFLRARLGSESSSTPPPPPNNNNNNIGQGGDPADVLDVPEHWSRSPSTISATDSRTGPFGDLPLGPGGNARWDARRTSDHDLGPTPQPRAPSIPLGPADQRLPYYMYLQTPVPAEKRVLVKSCEFDLREHTATLKCGTRGLVAGTDDPKRRGTRISW